MIDSSKRTPKKGHKSSNSLSKKGSSPITSMHRSSISSISDRLSTQTSDLSLSEKLHTSSSIRDQALKRPISLIILGKYFSDLCINISSRGCVDQSLLNKVDTMKEVLKDCLSAIPDIKLEAYVLISSSLKEIQSLRDSKDQKDLTSLSSLTSKLGNIALMIEENRLRNRVDRSPAANEDEIVTNEPEDLGKELEVRVSRVTARVLNIWKKIVSPQKEAEVICYCFLLLYSEIDRNIKLSPVIKSSFDKPTDMMKNYINNPGYVVTILRHTKDYIEKELISVTVMRRLYGFLEKLTIERVRQIDKTLTGFVLYELIFYSVMYYNFCYNKKYGYDLFDKKVNWRKVKSNKKLERLNSENSVQVTETDVFDQISVAEPKKIIVLDKRIRSSSQQNIRMVRKASVDKLNKNGLFVLKEKLNKKKQKLEKDKELINNLKLKFKNAQRNLDQHGSLSPKSRDPRIN